MKVDQRERTIVQKYTVYIAKDGKEFESKEKCENYEKILDGTRIVCPFCGGKGSQGKWIERYDYWNCFIKDYEPYYEHHTCQRCGGKGYLDKKIIWE